MTTTRDRWMTLADYLDYEDGTEQRYELVHGELVEMPSESDLNNLIAVVLMFALGQFVAPQFLRRGTEVAVTGARATVRLPDLVVLSEEGAIALQGASRSIILPDMPPPLLVVEVVSPGKANQDRDYRYKRSEYAARGIAEYWIIDPEAQQVMILTWVDGWYEEAIFQGGDRLISTQFPQLELTAAQVLEPTTAA